MPNADNPKLKISKSKKKKFSSFRKDEAFQYLDLTDLLPWTIETDSVQPSNFFQEHLARLNRHFDLESYEESKKLLIDAICDEAIIATATWVRTRANGRSICMMLVDSYMRFSSKCFAPTRICPNRLGDCYNTCDRLKIWKGAQLESDRLAGYVDYLIAERKRFLDLPLLCIIEAKKDNFEQGLAQCLVELHACQWKNQQSNHNIDVLGIVTNGEGWRFYKLAIDRKVYETPLYSIGDMELLLGRLRYVFQLCQQNLP